jgi:hypothetical protein
MGACSLLFCAAERGGAFTPNITARLRTRVSRFGGFTRHWYRAGRLEATSDFD